MGERDKREEYIQKTTDLLTWQPCMGINDGERVLLPRQKMALAGKWGKEILKKQGNWEILSGLPSWLCQMGIEN